MLDFAALPLPLELLFHLGRDLPQVLDRQFQVAYGRFGDGLLIVPAKSEQRGDAGEVLCREVQSAADLVLDQRRRRDSGIGRAPVSR